MPITSWFAPRVNGRASPPAVPANRAIRRAAGASPGPCSAPAEWWPDWTSDHRPAAASTEGSTRTVRLRQQIGTVSAKHGTLGKSLARIQHGNQKLFGDTSGSAVVKEPTDRVIQIRGRLP